MDNCAKDITLLNKNNVNLHKSINDKNNIFSSNDAMDNEQSHLKESSVKIKNKKNNSNCCFLCKKKTILLCTCKCGTNYCIEHRNPESHNCEFDHKNYDREQLAKNNPRIVAEKIKKI
jgi:hypothetical protein